MAASKVKEEKEARMPLVSPVATEVQAPAPRGSWWYRPGEGVAARIVSGLVLWVSVVLVIYGVHRELRVRGVYGQGTASAWVVPIVASLVAAGVIGVLLNRPGLGDLVIRFDERQHWLFGLDWYKPTQGKMTRWATFAGAAGLVGWGIYALYYRMPIGTTQTGVTLGLTVFALWAIFRLVNMPTFVDFLVGTEAELNKVSWPRGQELKQAVIVVLACVFLLSLFLFGMDRVWSFMLQFIGVLRLTSDSIDVQGMLWGGAPVNPFV